MSPRAAPYGSSVTTNGPRLAAVLAGLVLAASACGGGDEEEPFPLDTLPTPATESPSPTGDPTAEETGAAEPALPEECGDVIRFVDVADALAVPMTGGVDRIYAEDFHPDSGRLARLTCTYRAAGDDDDGEDEDDPDEDAEPAVEFNVSSYVDADAASRRLSGTVDSARTGGDEVESVEIAGLPGFFLRGDDAVSYVAAVDELTYVVSLQRGVVADPAVDVVLILLVERILGQPSPTPTE